MGSADEIPEKPMLTVKEAAQAAENYLRELLPEKELRYLRLEEIERSSDGQSWLVTLGWVEPAYKDTSASLLAYGGVGIQKLPRVYKVFDVDARNGEVRSMKIRDVD